MIFLSPECFPCMLRQADLAARAQNASDEARIALAARVCGMLRDLPSRDEIPAVAATRLQEILRDSLGTDNPFGPMKERILSRFEEMAKRARGLVAGAPDPWAAAVRLSASATSWTPGSSARKTWTGRSRRSRRTSASTGSRPGSGSGSFRRSASACSSTTPERPPSTFRSCRFWPKAANRPGSG
jgi:hypothetical protein